MNFFNSLPIRIALAIVGGLLYAALTYSISMAIDLSVEFAISASAIVFFFYLASRFVLLLSGIKTDYYSKEARPSIANLYEGTSFYQIAQWVGKFYHYHDWVLFIFLAALCAVFLISLALDWTGHKAIGDTMRNLLNPFVTLP